MGISVCVKNAGRKPAWWCTPLIPALGGGRGRQISEFKASLVCCHVCSRPARKTRPPVLLTAVYSANFRLHLSRFNLFSLHFSPSSISLKPQASHSYILSVPIHSQQAASPHQARSFSQSGRQGHVSTKYGLV